MTTCHKCRGTGRVRSIGDRRIRARNGATWKTPWFVEDRPCSCDAGTADRVPFHVDTRTRERSFREDIDERDDEPGSLFDPFDLR